MRTIRSMAEKPALLALDNLASLVGFERGDPDSWNGLQQWLLALRRAGVAVLAVHHANKEGDQRGTSRREDILDAVLAVRRPADYSPRDGARFELHFEKARGLFADAVEPVEARLETDEAGLVRWNWRPVHLGQFAARGGAVQGGPHPRAGRRRARGVAGDGLPAQAAGGGDGCVDNALID